MNQSKLLVESSYTLAIVIGPKLTSVEGCVV